jgi:16S rRNA (guanine527-N7)-methyltransferase
MTKTEFKQQIKANFKNIDKDFFTNIEKYKTIIQKSNEEVNLSNLVSEEKIYAKYFLDSIIPYKDVDFSGEKKLLDIGSGSGIPGVILKLLYPNIKLSVLDSNNKKINFIKTLCNELKIEVETLYKRAEEMNNNEREKFDIVTSRAVAPLNAILEISIPYAKVNGIIIEPKSKNINGELNDKTKILLKNIGCEILKIDNFIFNENTHNIIFIKKIYKTANTYPRA